MSCCDECHTQTTDSTKPPVPLGLNDHWKRHCDNVACISRAVITRLIWSPNACLGFGSEPTFQIQDVWKLQWFGSKLNEPRRYFEHYLFHACPLLSCALVWMRANHLCITKRLRWAFCLDLHAVSSSKLTENYTSGAHGLTTTWFSISSSQFWYSCSGISRASWRRQMCERKVSYVHYVLPLRYTCCACMDTHSVIIETAGRGTESLPSLWVVCGTLVHLLCFITFFRKWCF